MIFGFSGFLVAQKRWFRKTTQAFRYSLKGKNTIAQGRADRSVAKVGAALGSQATAQSSER